MKKIFGFTFLLFFGVLYSQNEQIANNYFDRGDFEKAMISYEDLLKSQPNNFNYFNRLVECYQQMKQYDKAQTAIISRLEKYKSPIFMIELGYNYQLMKEEVSAKRNYQEAIDLISVDPNSVYSIASSFEKKFLTDYALQAYQAALDKDPKMNFNYQMALLYGQKADFDKMIEMFLDESERNPQSLIMIQNQFSRFMTDDASETFNDSLKKALLLRTQKSQDVYWNQYLSWFFVQNKEYGKAFIQEKAIYKRNSESLSNIVNLAQLAIDEKESETATEILRFVLENTQDEDLKIKAHSYLMEMKIKNAQAKDYPAITTELDNLVNQFGIVPQNLDIILQKAHFTAFQLKNPEAAKNLLKQVIELKLNREQMATAKMELADILLLEEKFNQALLYYSQIEVDNPGVNIGQEASLKIAKTSYFQNDFNWAQSQLGVLKSANSQLIANDAMDLFLLIQDNSVEDSTQVAIKKFAKADYYIYQDKKPEAIEALKNLLKEHKEDKIVPVTLLRLGKLYESQNDTTTALAYYKQILDEHKDCIYIDEALYFSGLLYMNTNDTEKAKTVFEQVIMNHPDSIYYVESQKKYRKLRGDKEL